MINKKEFHTNIAGKIRNTKLPKRKALWPLFETISNSIHAIEEKGNLESGHIQIYIIRNGKPDTLKDLKTVDNYPVKSIHVYDNGIGFNDENLESFLTAETEYKIEKGARGIGRFVALKAFSYVNYESSYKNRDNSFCLRRFTFKPTGNGIFNYSEDVGNEEKTWSIVELNGFKEEYKKYCPKKLEEIGEKIVEHFLIYFLQEKCPYIKIIDQNGKDLLLQNYYNTTFKGSIKEKIFNIENYNFTLYLLRVFNTRKTHQIHYCANNREVKHEALNNYIPDLGRKIDDEDNNHFVYHSYLTSSFFDEVVDSDRIDFNISNDENEEEKGQDPDEISLANIRKLAIESIEELLEPYLSAVREKKFEEYQAHIYESSPQFKTILKYHPESIKKLQPNLSGNKLDIELFKVQNSIECEVKRLGEEVLNADEDFKNSEDYQEKYSQYIEKFNDIGKANLAKYI